MAIREYKSNLFSMLMQEPAYALEVYNVLNNTNYQDESAIEIFMLENGVSLSIRNDASFIVGCDLNIYEHQSTLNPNMPLRHLIYVAELFSNYIKSMDLFGSKLIRIPNPKFVVFYNDRDKEPEKKIMKLSDSYFNNESEPLLELICVQYNINTGKNENLKTKSDVLKYYMEFCETVRSDGPYNNKEQLRESIKRIILDFIEKGKLASFLKLRGDEVIEMATLDYTFERRIEIAKNESFEQGIEQGVGTVIKKLLKSMTPQEVAVLLDKPIDEINNYI